MNKARVFSAAALCIAGLGASGVTQAVNIIQNPGFELTYANWQTSGFQIFADPLWAHSGPGMARSACVGPACLSESGKGAYIRQLLPTVAGEFYDVSFWVRSYNGAGEFSVFWDGAKIDDQIEPNGPMLMHSYASLTASSNGTMLEIHGRNDTAYISFDDFLVVQALAPPGTTGPVGAVPEPLTYAMLLAGFAIVGVSLRRQR
jgi:hypothetical protein